MINWKLIADIPAELKDGRSVLLWCASTTPSADVGTWNTGKYWDDEDEAAGGYWEALYEGAKIFDVSHYAQINPPTP